MTARGFLQSLHVGKPPIQVEVCCETFLEATAGGTDNEGYGSLISIGYEPGKWKIGCFLPAPRFCPWCGRPVTEVPEDNYSPLQP